MDKTIMIGDKILRVHHFESVAGKEIPVIEVEAEETKHPDGRVDITVKVPCLKLEPGINPNIGG